MGFEIDIAWLTLLLFGSLAVLLALGLPMAFCTGSLAVVFLFLFGNSAILNMMPSRIFPFMTDYQLSAVPLFIFMAAMLVIKWLDTSDARFAKVMRPIALPVRDISTIESLSKTPSTLGVVIIVGVAAAVVGLSIWIFAQFLTSD
jgi:TRAP-type mannitol/chloroaromatic compound transport system permease large subunit